MLNKRGVIDLLAVVIVGAIAVGWFGMFRVIDKKLHPGSLLLNEPIDKATGMVQSYDPNQVHFSKQTDFKPTKRFVPTMTEEEWNAHLAEKGKVNGHIQGK